MGIMKSKMGMLAMTAMMLGGAGMVGTGRNSYSPPPRRKEHPAPLGDTTILKEIPKGHKTELITIDVKDGDKIYTFMCMISFGTQKSRLKRIAGKKREIEQYVRRLPDDMLLARNEFASVFEIIKPTEDGKK